MSLKNPPELSIVSPVYKAEDNIEELIIQVHKVVSQITDNFEVILVEDCGGDQSWSRIKTYASRYSWLKGIKLSRNFGQHYAITAGLDYARGDWVVVMDCDLQDKPTEILNLYSKAKKGFDVVLAQRKIRKDGFLKKLFSKVFYRTLGYLTGSEQDESVANFGIYSRKVIDSVKAMRESIRFFPTMVKWVGFEQTTIKVDHQAREVGSSSYNFKRLLELALDIILAYSDKPIRLMVKAGFFISACSLIGVILTIYKWLTGSIEVVGYTSLIVSIWLLSGVLLSTLGIIGLYVGKTFEGVKNRPIYFVDEEIN